ncbi:pilus assembly protein [Asticcacaulis sp. ZE23SCel15]|uniref:TadE/TadG family type IV pilus assembly protein n=1 Tax=Asticcacaulis sp. ZE23SCel15 TaxID=3059027 RepID=UPI00265DCC2C|nr:TadE/TadG family type IV pilus assembly protein [Asticcacaulis sp. ZE23SCel15]WKL56229.1 pilus assembly protein [Asticcacaulis sp. ZE23SCel15]
MRRTADDISEVKSASGPRRRPKPWTRFSRTSIFRHFARNTHAATAVEFALISPILILMLAGIVDYGGYFWTSHAVQQMANDSARAAIAGTTATERLSLAQSMFHAQKSEYDFMTPGDLSINLNEQTDTYQVTITFTPDDGSFDLIGALPGMPTTITRTAAVARGGY